MKLEPLRRARVAAFVVIAAAAPLSGAFAACPEGFLCAGAGKADMTPPIGVPMGGFFSRSAASGPEPFAEQMMERGPDPNLYAKGFRQSEGIHTPLHVRALVVQDRAGERYAFVSIENRGAPYELHQAVTARLESAGAGIPAENLLFSSTHSHSAPSPLTPWTGYGIISTDHFDPRVFGIAAAAMTAAVLRAVEALEPARVGVGQTELFGASRNRRMDQYAANPAIDPENPPGADEAIDPEVTVIRAEAVSGRPIGAFYTFAIHGTSIGDGNDLFSGDNMGPAMRFCESALAAMAAEPGPAPVCAQANGTEGDISPATDDGVEWIPSAYAGAEQTGRRVADAVLSAWSAAAPADDADLDSRFTILYFAGQDGDPGQPTSPVPLVGVGGNFGDGVGLPLDLPFQGNKVPIPAGPGGYPQWVPLQAIRVGDTAFLSVPTEMTLEMGRRIRDAALEAADGAFSRTVIVGLANAYASYTATPEEYATNHYEGAWTLYGPQEGNLLRNELVRLVADMAAGRPGESLPPIPLGEHLSIDETPAIFPDDAALVGTIVAPPESAARGDVVSMSWIGGNPAVDRPRGDTFVRLELETPDGAATIATEDDVFSIVRVDRPDPRGPHTWTARFDLPLDLPTGSYRIRVGGRFSEAGGSSPYAVESTPVEIAPADTILPGLRIDGTNGSGEPLVGVEGAWPAPAGERYATRPKRAAPGSAVLTVRRAGAVFTEVIVPLDTPTAVPAVSGDQLVVAPGALTDIHGNRNTTEASIPVP